VNQFNTFVLGMNHNLRKYDVEKRKRILSKIVADLENTDIFSRLADEETDDDFESEEGIDTSEIVHLKEEIILEKQREYGIEPDGPMSEEDNKERFIRQQQWGKRPLHEAVAASDLAGIRKLVVEGADVTEVDNNGHTPLYLAVLEENHEVVALFKELGFVA
jgi:hypothetical protein